MRKKKFFDADGWLKRHLEKLVDSCAGEYILVSSEGKIYRGGSPSQLREKAKSENPEAELMGIRVPRPEDFICALIIL